MSVRFPDDNDTIAVVIPVHNKEAYVARAISSVLAQTRAVDELILVDDASTDGSLKQIATFRDPRIRLLQRTEPGPGGYAARNLAIQHATARWIAFLDADDSWHANFIEETSRLIGRASARVGCVFTGYESVWADRATRRDRYSAHLKGDEFTTLDFDGFVESWLRFHDSPIWTSASVFRREILLKAGLFPERRCRRGGDKDLWLRVMSDVDALASPRVCATYYRETANQVTRTTGTNVRHCLCATIEAMIAESSGVRLRLLKRLFNQEVFGYARLVGQRERVSPEIYRGFFIAVSPGHYVALLALTYLPITVQKIVRRAALWGRAFARRPARKAACNG